MPSRLIHANRILTVLSIILILAMPFLSVLPAYSASIFEDGFETGDMSKWSPNNGVTVTSGNAHHGTYKAVLDTSGEYAQKRFTAIDHCFMRAYVMFRSFPTSGSETPILGLFNTTGWYMSEARVINVAGTIKWRLRYYDHGVSYAITSEQQKPALNTWYCVEVEGKSNSATDAEARIYIDGSELTDVAQTGKNNTRKINCGYIWESVTGGVIQWYDCVVIAGAYIGPEQQYLTVSSPYGTTGGEGWYDYGSTAYATLDTGSTDHGNSTRHVFVDWSEDATGTDYASSDPITMDANKTALAVWKTQYSVTFDHTGLDDSASGTVVTVNDVPVMYSELPYSIWVDSGGTVTYSYSDVASTEGGKRFVLGSVSGEASPITVAGPTLVKGNYFTQYQVVFDQTGVGSDFTDTMLTVDGADYGYASLPAEFWWDDGSSHSFSFMSPLTVNVSRQYYWASTSGLSMAQSDTLTIIGSGSVTGNYGTLTRHNITFGTSNDRGAWSFEEGSGAVAHDSSGYGNDGTLYGGVTWINGKVGKALSFDGTSGYVEVPDSSSLDITGRLTLDAWIYPLSLTARQLVVCKYNHTSLSSSFYLGVGGTLGTVTYMNKVYYALTYDGNHYYAMVSNTNLTTNTWTHVTTVCNVTHMSIYINGALDAVRAYPPHYIYPSTAKIRIGCYLPEAGVARYFNGTIDEVRVEENSSHTDFLGTVVTIDDIDYAQSQLPISFWWDEGSSHTFTFQSPLVVSANSKRYVWISTTGLSTLQSETITVLTSGSITANYKTQYYLEVDSAYDSPTPASGWFDVGTEIAASITSPVTGSTGTRYVCTGWTGTGDVPASGTSLSTNFAITQASSITWNWKTQYLLTVITDPEGLSPQPMQDPLGEAETPNSWWYDEPSSVSLTAGEVSYYIFIDWTVDEVSRGSSVNPIAVNMDSPHTAIAHYFSIGTSDIAVLSIQTSKIVVGKTYTLSVNVTVENQRESPESFNVTLFANATIIGTRKVTDLAGGTQITLLFGWDTSDVAYGKYILKATADILPGEADTADNTLSDGHVAVTIPGDVDGDFDVDIFDVVSITSIYGKKLGDPGYNPDADIDSDDLISIYDLVMCTAHYAQKWP